MPEHPDRHPTGEPSASDATFLSRVVDALPDLIFAKDVHGRYLLVNEAFAASLGRPREAIIGRRDGELRSTDEANRERTADESCLEHREPVDTGTTTRAPVIGPDGRLIGVAGISRVAMPGIAPGGPAEPFTADTPASIPNRDETARPIPNAPPAPRLTGDADGLDRLDPILDALPVAIYMKNADGTYSGGNAAFARMIGARDTGDVVGRRDTDFRWRAIDHPRLDEEVMHDGQARHGVQRREVDRFARRRWTETSVVPRTDSLGRVIGVVGIRIDVTVHRQELEQAERARVAAERASASKSAFLTQMSHELRTPLTSLLGFAELAIEESDADPSAHGHLLRIRDNGWQLLALVDDLLDLSRIESGRLAIRPRPFSPHEIIEGLIATYTPRFQASGLDLQFQIDASMPATAGSDPVRFRQILANLLERALRETPTGGVRLRASASGRDAAAALMVEVRDDGPAIDTDLLHRRLHPFDVEPGEGEACGSACLGIAIAWSLADLLDGRIDHEQGPGGAGNRFTLRLPLRSTVADPAFLWTPESTTGRDPWQRVETAARDGVAWFAATAEDLSSDVDASPPAPAAGARASAAGEVAGGRDHDDTESRRILLAEDTPDTARFLSLVLRSRGHTVVHAADGQEALARYRESAERGEPFDLVLTDVQMPELDGLGLARRLRDLGWTGGIIALTAHASPQHRREALEAGCDEHVAKPLKPDDLHELVRRHTARRRADAA